MIAALERDTHETLRTAFAGAHLRVTATQKILESITLILAREAKAKTDDAVTVDVSVSSGLLAFEISSRCGTSRVLPRTASHAQVAAAVLSVAVELAARHRGYVPLPAYAVESDGQALVFVGDDPDSALLIAAHLHVRGWRLLGAGNVYLDASSGYLYPIKQSFSINSSSIADLPASYRPSLEASPWYATRYGIVFYAVDPAQATNAKTWGDRGRLAAVVFVDGSIGERAALAEDKTGAVTRRLVQLGVASRTITVATLQTSKIGETCDLVERWFESIRSRD